MKVLHGPEGQGRDRSGVLRILILEDVRWTQDSSEPDCRKAGSGASWSEYRAATPSPQRWRKVGSISSWLTTTSSLTSQAAVLKNAWLYKELNDRERALQNLVKRLLGAQEEERRRVAYEVHDGLAQVAVAAHQNLQAFARRYAPETEQGRRELDRILGQVRTTVSDARRVIANLRPTALDDLGLAAAISLEVERLNEDGYQVDWEEHLGDESLPRD